MRLKLGERPVRGCAGVNFAGGGVNDVAGVGTGAVVAGAGVGVVAGMGPEAAAAIPAALVAGFGGTGGGGSLALAAARFAESCWPC